MGGLYPPAPPSLIRDSHRNPAHRLIPRSCVDLRRGRRQILKRHVVGDAHLARDGQRVRSALHAGPVGRRSDFAVRGDGCRDRYRGGRRGCPAGRYRGRHEAQRNGSEDRKLLDRHRIYFFSIETDGAARRCAETEKRTIG